MSEPVTKTGNVFRYFAAGLIGVMFVAAGVYYLLYYKNASRKTSASVGDFVTLSVNPAKPVASPGQLVTTTINLATMSRAFGTQGYKLKMVFDKNALAVQQIDYKLGQVSTGLGDDTNSIGKVNTIGMANLVGEITSQDPFVVSANLPVVAVTFKVINPNFNSADISIDGNFVEVKSDFTLGNIPITIFGFTIMNSSGVGISPAPAITSTIDNSPTPSPTGTACIPRPACLDAKPPCGIPEPAGGWCPVTPTPGSGNTTLNMKVKFQGIVTRPRVNAPLNVQVTVKGQGQPITQTVMFLSDLNGIWYGTMNFNLQSTTDNSATYSIYFKGPRHLKKRICDTLPNEDSPGTYNCTTDAIKLTVGTDNFDFSSVYLLAGDLPINGNQDGIIDADDTSYISLHYGSTDPDVLQVADLNMDGVIDTQDMALAVNSLNTKYDDK